MDDNSTNLQPPFLGPARAAWPPLMQFVRVAQPNPDGTYQGFIQQWNKTKFRDREAVTVYESNGFPLVPSILEGRLDGDWLGKPLVFVSTACCRAPVAFSSSSAASAVSSVASAASSVSPGAFSSPSPSPSSSSSLSSATSRSSSPSSRAAAASVPSSSSSASGIATNCCSNVFPSTLHATVTSSIGGCAGITFTTGSVPLVWNGSRWVGDGTFTPGGGALHMEFYCKAGGLVCTDLNMDTGGCVSNSALTPAAGSCSCNPLSATFSFIAGAACCNGGSGNVSITVTV